MTRTLLVCLIASIVTAAEPFRGYLLTDDETVFISVDNTEDIIVRDKGNSQAFESRVERPGQLFIEASANEIALTTHGTAYGLRTHSDLANVPITHHADSHEIDNEFFKTHTSATVVITTPKRSLLLTYTIFDDHRIVSLAPTPLPNNK